MKAAPIRAEKPTMKTKTKLTWLAVAAGAICLAFNAYALYRFGWGWGTTTAAMNEAGGFLGGVVGPFLNFITLIAVLYTTAMQAEELRISNETLAATKVELAQSRETSQRQLAHTETESRKNSILKVLGLLDLDIQSCLNTKYHMSSRYSDSLKSALEFMEACKKNGANIEESHNYMILQELSILIMRLNEYLIAYEVEEVASPVVAYYEYKYSGIAQELERYKLVRQDRASVFLRI
ncbi:hypothetical protein [Azospirillum sp. TSH58]|uniref:hypothetical protein n=1 Tax=Azospirillum sp. TSH58 TaxID=664962 RepID=UPI0013048BB9|nr:hypothetical protein [Azospirillum sp. TSH58]